MKKILIIGAGISGLTAAYRLKGQGNTLIKVVESTSTPGGWVQTSLDSQGGRIEKGPQLVAMQVGTPLHQLFSSLRIPLTIHRNLTRFIGIGGQLIPVPKGLIEFIKTPILSTKGKIRLLLEPFFNLMLNRKQEYSLEQEIIRRFGSEVGNRIAPAMINGILGTNASEVSQESLPIFGKSNQRSILLHSIKQPPPILATPKFGMGHLTAILAANCDVRYGTKITNLEFDQSQWSVTVNGSIEKYDSVLLAISAQESAQLLSSIYPRLSESLANIEYTSLYLSYSTHSPSKFLQNTLGFLLHPSESNIILGCFVSSSIDESTHSEKLQLRTFIKAYSVEKPNWNIIYSELLKWIPDLSPAQYSHIDAAHSGIPKIKIGQLDKINNELKKLPKSIDWIAGARFGPGVKDIVEGIDRWISTTNNDT